MKLVSVVNEMVREIQGFGPTSTLYRKSYPGYPKHKLRNSDDHKPGDNGNIFHRHSVYSTTAFSATDSKLVNNKKNSQPEGQCHLHEERTNYVHKEGVPHEFVASISLEIRQKCSEILIRLLTAVIIDTTPR